ncbi:MAG: vWA domain-containing protein, partial [Planctomycetota bacterium]
LTACLSMLLLGQQDAVGVTTVDTAVRLAIPPRSNFGHMNSILQVLAQSKPGGETSLGAAIQTASAKIKRRGMVILVSDCFDDVERLMKSLRYFRHQGHDVIVLQIWDQDELEFPFRNRTEFRSLENASRHLLDPGSLRKAYLKRVEEFQQQLETETAKLRIDLVSCHTLEPCGDVLTRLIAKRQRGRAAKK